MDTQADLILRWAHRSFIWFCRAAARILVNEPKLSWNSRYPCNSVRLGSQKGNIENVTRVLFIKLKYDSLLHSYLINHFAGRQKTWVKRLLQGHGNTQTQVHEITVTVLGELDVVYVAFGGSFIVVCECPLACNILRFLSFIQRLNIIWATSWENLFMPYANNKGADQLAHPGSLISAVVVTAWIVQYLTFL